MRYLDEISQDCLNHNALVVLAKGLGLNLLLYRMVRHFLDGSKLTLFLNISDAQISCFNTWLKRDGYEKQIKKLDYGITDLERQREYLLGGCLCVTNRILIVDLLSKILPSEIISGIFVNHAERVTDQRNEGFILRVFRQSNKVGFIKAFSEDAETLSRGFLKVERILKNLFLSKLFLWPRFHLTVSSGLEEKPLEVIEMHMVPTSLMAKAQEALVEVIDGCLSELKVSTKLNSISLENGLSYSFDKMIRKELEPVWDQVSYKTRSLLNNISTLRQCLTFLLSYDCVSFYRFLSSVRSEAIKAKYLWLLTDATNRLFNYAKARCFVITKNNNNRTSEKGKKNSNEAESENKIKYKSSVLHLVLEQSPKWEIVSELIKEIKGELNAQTKSAPCVSDDEDDDVEDIEMKHEEKTSKTKKKASETEAHKTAKKGRLLIVCQDERSCIQLSTFLDMGGDALIKARFRHFLYSQRLSTPSFSSTTSSSSVEGEGGGGGGQGANGAGQSRVEEMELLRRCLEKLREQDDNDKARAYFDSFAEEKALPTLAPDEDPPDLGNKNHSTPQSYKRKSANGLNDSGNKKKSKGFEPEVKKPVRRFEHMLDTWKDDPELPMLIRHVKLVDEVLESFQPNYVIMYDPDVQLIRQLEVYQSMREDPVRVYFMVFKETAEEQRYLTALKREKEAFESLIVQKAHMTVAQEEEIMPELPKNLTKQWDLGPEDGFRTPTYDAHMACLGKTATATRKGGVVVAVEKGKVIIDVREFRSGLPAYLHLKDLLVIPATIEVGDYILTPHICVERKSIPDLIGSFSSGRLYHQMEIMCRHYTLPVLLIEFDPEKPFNLQVVTGDEMRSEISAKDTLSKIVLLIMTFPRMRLLWSKGPNHTGSLFLSLKKGRDQPDLTQAVGVGREMEGDDKEASLTPYDVLLQLPGISTNNVRRVMQAVKSLEELAQMSKEGLLALLGTIDGGKLYTFMHTDNAPYFL